MTTLAVMIFLTLTMIASLHVIWSFGVHWPLEDERDLVALAIGQTGRTRMPTSIECLGAASAIFAGGLTALAIAGLVIVPGPPELVTAAGIVATVLFSARGVAPYLPGWRRAFAQEPFATLDRSWYGPLCLLLGLAFALLVLERAWSPE